MVVFGDKRTGKYIETEYSEVTNRRIIVKWHNYPIEIIYYHHVRSEDQYMVLTNWLCNILLDSKNMSDARKVLEMSFYKESIARDADEIRDMKNKAFDNINTMDELYWFGVFDALRWVLGDEVEGF